MLTPDYQHKLV